MPLRHFAAALLLVVVLPASARAQAEEEPTPFWGSPPPPEQAPAKRKRKAPTQLPSRVTKSRPKPDPRAAEPVAPAPAPFINQISPLMVPDLKAPPPPAPAQLPQTLTAAPHWPAEPETESPPPPPGPSARFGLDLAAGAWGKGSASGGPRAYDFAYGLRAGWALRPDAIELDLLLARAGGTQGNPFANATATHTLIGLRAFAVLGPGQQRLALLLGAGVGTTLAQTHYSLPSSGGVTQTLDATSGKLVIMGTAALRLRLELFEARAEFSPVLRDGRLEFLPLFALGLGLW